MTQEIVDLMMRDDRTLTPGDAVVGIIVADGQYLLQGRDVMSGIFYPGHWGFFGGAMNDGESELETLARELSEELALDIAASDASWFTRHTFDFSRLGGEVIHRSFYEIAIRQDQVDTLVLGEGSGMRLFDPDEALSDRTRMTPYDAFVLWMHAAQQRFAFPAN